MAGAEAESGPGPGSGADDGRPVVVAGVSGSGKSTIGRLLAERLGLPFRDGDDLHTPADVALMAAGHALSDADRWPWLADVGAWLAEHRGVVACSALKVVYRDRIRAVVPDVAVVLLDGDPGLLRARQSHRAEHFMPASLMSSQLDTLEPLEPGECGLTVDVAVAPEQVVATYVEWRERHAPS